MAVNGQGELMDVRRCASGLPTGCLVSFALSLILVLVWAATGPLFHYRDSWQLVINTGTTVVTFDAQALQLKLDELIRANRNARNSLAGN
jgi:low affinity Fe/Cu permease